MSALLVGETGASHHKSSTYTQPNSDTGNIHAHVHLKTQRGYTNIHFCTHTIHKKHKIKTEIRTS